MLLIAVKKHTKMKGLVHRLEVVPSKVACHSAKVKREAWLACSMRQNSKARDTGHGRP